MELYIIKKKKPELSLNYILISRNATDAIKSR